MSADALIYGVRGPDPRNTVVRCYDRTDAEQRLLPGDVIVVSTDSGRTWAVEQCNHCHDDPPRGHTCPACGREEGQNS